MPAGIAAVTVSQISFSFFTVVLRLDSLTLKWRATTAADLNYGTYQAVQLLFCNVMTFFCFLEGAFPASLVAFCISPMVLFKVYGIALNTMKKYIQTLRDHFLL